MIKIRKLLSLTPEEGLEQQLLFWLAIGLPILIAVGLGGPIWIEYSFAFDELAYKKFVEISKLPIGIASLSIPLAVLIARLHGTKQTALQIENSEQDNKTKLYLSHFDHFCTHIDFVESSLVNRFSSIIPTDDKVILNKLAMYRLIYPNNSLANGVKPLGTHLNVFSKNTMTRLHKRYREFLHCDEDTFDDKLRLLENEFLNVQLACFRCQKTRESIFNKIPLDNNKQGFIFGISPSLTDYYPQFEFFLELLSGIESFEYNKTEERTGDKILSSVRVPHLNKPHESDDLWSYWVKFKKKNINKQ